MSFIECSVSRPHMQCNEVLGIYIWNEVPVFNIAFRDKWAVDFSLTAQSS